MLHDLHVFGTSAPPARGRYGEGVAGVREQKKVATRHALSDAALELAAERGVGKVTVEAIAERADVSVRTFFNYFSAKEEAMVASHREEIELLLTELRDRPTDEPILESLRLTAHALAAPSARLVRIRQLAQQIGTAPELLSFRLRAFAEIEQELTGIIAARTTPVTKVATADTDDRELYSSVLANTVIAVISAVLRSPRVSTGDGVAGARIDAAFVLLEQGFHRPRPT